jgi:hypothetical protein
VDAPRFGADKSFDEPCGASASSAMVRGRGIDHSTEGNLVEARKCSSVIRRPGGGGVHRGAAVVASAPASAASTSKDPGKLFVVTVNGEDFSAGILAR